MIKLHQALWGYENGHHLLSSSISLSGSAKKMLSSLSDISGSRIPDSFDGYLTGCFLPEEDCYALSKTWYAHEMSRPGCVWTHTLFLTSEVALALRRADLEELFKRPNSGSKKKEYAKPLVLEMPMSNSRDRNIKSNSAVMLFDLLTQHLEPIVITSPGNLEINWALEDLILWSGIDFFKNISFCTGSLCNRMLNRVPLDLQIVPHGIAKSVFTIGTEKVFYGDILKCEQSFHNKRHHFGGEFSEIKKLCLTFGRQYYNRRYWSKFERVFEIMHGNINFLLDEIIVFLRKCLPSEIVARLTGMIYEKKFPPVDHYTLQKNTSLNVLLEYCTTADPLMQDWGGISKDVLEGSLVSLWRDRHEEMLGFLPRLFANSLNPFGESVLQYSVTLLDTDDLSALLQDSAELCPLLIRLNWRLAFCYNVWMQPKSIQTESLLELRPAVNEGTVQQSKWIALLELIFQVSSYEFSKELNLIFGTTANQAYFDWFDRNHVNEDALHRWVGICSYDQKYTLKRLSHTNSAQLFQTVLSVLDSYAECVIQESPQLWEDFFQRFCLDDTYGSVAETYAQFALPVILRSNAKFSPAFSQFVFLTVHRILAENKMDYSVWERLLPILPEMPWYQDWDKCKRLRIAARDKGYDIKFETHSPDEKV